MRIIQLSVTTDGSGDGTATDATTRKGYVLAWIVDYAATADAGTDVDLDVVSAVGPNIHIDNVDDTNTDWTAPRYPLGYPNAPGEDAITDPLMPIPFCGQLKLTVAGGGNAVTDCAVATIYIADVP